MLLFLLNGFKNRKKGVFLIEPLNYNNLSFQGLIIIPVMLFLKIRLRKILLELLNGSYPGLRKFFYNFVDG